MINCPYFKDIKRPDMGVCQLGLYGGRPSTGVCTSCIKSGNNTPAYAQSQRLAASLNTPTLLKKVQNAAGAAGRVVKAAAQGKAVRVSEEEQNKRLAICKTNQCGQYDSVKNVCKICGCLLKFKTMLATEKCPKGFWGAEVPVEPPVQK